MSQVKSMSSICEIQIGPSFSPKWTLCFKVALASWQHIADIDIAFETCYEPGQLHSTCEVGIWSVQQVAKLSCSQTNIQATNTEDGDSQATNVLR